MNRITIKLPQYELARKKIASNYMQQIGLPETIINAFVELDTENKNYWKIFTDLDTPFDVIYIKQWNKRTEIINDVPILKLSVDTNLESINEYTKLSWIQVPLTPLSPTEITASWNNQFQYKQDNPTSGLKGLRPPQIGALHAIASKFTSKKDFTPLTVILPTGTGKTETMLATVVSQQCSKVLILVPSDSLRQQIFKKFTTFGCLADLGVIPKIINYPAVFLVKHGLKTEEEAIEIIESSNVIIATASILNHSSQAAKLKLFELCTHLFIDEAHHVAASTWNNIRENFKDKRVIQFTATPFRNDGKDLGGKIVFNYSLGEAQEDGYFKKISLKPIKEYDLKKSDIAIANKAVEQLRSDISENYDHLVMARVNEKPKAEELLAIYQSIAPEFNPIVVHSGLTSSQNNQKLEELKTRHSRIVICVDMLGEGYDLPNLKIAALHDQHKSLAITLQFIGRFTRSSSNTPIGDASAIANIADVDIQGGLQKLYAQDANWDLILKRLSEERINNEIKLQDVIDSLRGNGGLDKQISLWNLRPSCSAMLFKTECQEWGISSLENLNLRFAQTWHAISNEDKILIILGVRNTPVNWGKFEDIDDTNHYIFILNWDEEREAVFVYSNDHDAFKTEDIAKVICGENTIQITGETIFKVLDNVQLPLVKNLGSSQVGAISFTQFFGPNVTDGLSQIEKSSSELNNIAVLGYENGDRVVWGCSQKKGKIWSPKAGNLVDWQEWSQNAWDKIHSEDEIDVNNLVKDFLKPIRINKAYKYYPLFAEWGETLQNAFEDKVNILFDQTEIPLFLADLDVFKDESEQLYIKIYTEDLFGLYRLNISDQFPSGYMYEHVEGSLISIKTHSSTIPFEEKMVKDPVRIHYVDGSMSYNCYLIQINLIDNTFDVDGLNQINWTVDITKESMGKARTRNTVQFQTLSMIQDQFEIIINDDGSGEIADLVALRQENNEIILSLYHCKYSSSPEAGRRLADMYEVCGQAQRSIRWKHAGLKHLFKHINGRNNKWLSEGFSRFVKGELAELEKYRNMANTMPIKLEVTIVQPGLSKSVITEEISKLLACTESYIKKTTRADLKVWCST